MRNLITSPAIQLTHTHHSLHRMQQRGITQLELDWAIRIGTVLQKQGLDMVVIRDKDIPETTPAYLIKKLRGLVIYLNEGALITAFKGGKRAHHNLRKKDKVNRKKR